MLRLKSFGFLTLISLIGSDYSSYFSYEKQEMVLMSNYVFSEAKKHSRSV
jgi:hypothetical protein